MMLIVSYFKFLALVVPMPVLVYEGHHSLFGRCLTGALPIVHEGDNGVVHKVCMLARRRRGKVKLGWDICLFHMDDFVRWFCWIIVEETLESLCNEINVLNQNVVPRRE
jgi:hypothetical protein